MSKKKGARIRGAQNKKTVTDKKAQKTPGKRFGQK